MGSLSYLGNFDMSEYQRILDSTALFNPARDPSEIRVEYRTRLEITLEDIATNKTVDSKRRIINVDGDTDY
jgi:hypothetical protein